MPVSSSFLAAFERAVVDGPHTSVTVKLTATKGPRKFYRVSCVNGAVRSVEVGFKGAN